MHPHSEIGIHIHAPNPFMDLARTINDVQCGKASKQLFAIAELELPDGTPLSSFPFYAILVNGVLKILIKGISSIRFTANAAYPLAITVPEVICTFPKDALDDLENRNYDKLFNTLTCLLIDFFEQDAQHR